MMMGTLQFNPGRASERQPLLCLITDHQRYPAMQVDLLAPFFIVRCITPGAILSLPQAEREEALLEAAGVLIHWGEQSPAILCAVKAFVHQQRVPLIALCECNEAEHVAALMVGADDVLTYPLSPLLLQARLRAYQRLVMRAATFAPSGGDGIGEGVRPQVRPALPDTHEVCTVGALTLDRTARRFFADGHAVDLTPKEFELMAFMMEHAGTCLSRHDLLDHVWGIDYVAETNVLGTQMYALRRKLEAYGLGDIIETVRGIGYRLVDVR